MKEETKYMRDNSLNKSDQLITIRTATPDDAAALLRIYEYYVTDTAITFEYDVPSEEEFRGRIEKILKKYPYIVAVEKCCDESSGHCTGEDGSLSAGDAGKVTAKGDTEKILGYAYAGVFKDREAYQYSVETTIYIDKDLRRGGIGRMLYEELENRLKAQGILNLNACIGYPEEEDEHLTFDSVKFHERLGYSMVGEFHKCGYKFGRWYNMVWMEKLIGEHVNAR